jgi:hypothetical protein
MSIRFKKGCQHGTIAGEPRQWIDSLGLRSTLLLNLIINRQTCPISGDSEVRVNQYIGKRAYAGYENCMSRASIVNS